MSSRALAAPAALAAALATTLSPGLAAATPGPDSVAVLANASVPGSVALAEEYAAARDVPARQICALPMPATEDLPLADFEAMVRAPLERCLTDAGVIDRVEAVVVARGVPLRVSMDVGGRSRRVSLAAALGLWRTTMMDGTPLLGRDPGTMADCGGTPCLAAAWRSGYRGGPFRAGFERMRDGVVHRPVLVTMLHGRSDDDAARLIDAAVASEGTGSGGGELLLMNGADPARGALDAEYDAVIASLSTLGESARRTPFDPELSGLTLAAFFTGTASIGAAIEGNTFVPGAIVDNLTSFGALPENFRETGEAQVSIARWVARGVTGVHGTTDEPLNNCFPSRQLLTDYVSGATLGEAYFGRMPFVYWHNLVLGDPMAAPYAERPEVALAVDGAPVGGPTVESPIALGTPLSVAVSAPDDRAVSRIAVYVDGVLHEERLDVDIAGRTFEHCLGAGHPESLGGDVQVLVAVTIANDVERGLPAVRGWRAFRASVVAGDGTCGASPGADAGVGADAGMGADAGSAAADAGPPPASGAGCGCRANPTRGPRGALLLLLAGLALALRRRSPHDPEARAHG
jgi:MYXO-CTERM domain-containing protein